MLAISVRTFQVPRTETVGRVRREAKQRRELRYLAAAASVLLGTVVMFHNVAAIYDGNSEAFTFELNQLFLVLLVPFIAVTAVLIGPAMLLRAAFLKVYVYSLAFLAALAWIYSSFLVWDFGLLDGSDWDFSIADAYRPYELAGLLAVWLILYRLVLKRAKVITTFFVLLNVVLVIPTALALFGDAKEADLDPRDNIDALYRFSNKKNTLIVLMDSFQSDLFRDLLREDPALADKFADFTLYPDTLGVAASTYLTLPAIHTGKLYQVGDNLRDFYTSAIGEDSFLNALASAGHEVALVNAIQGVCPERIELCIEADEVMHGKTRVLLMETARLLDLSLFRAVPLSSKQAIYRGQFWTVSPFVRSYLRRYDDGELEHVAANRVLKALVERGRIVSDHPTTKFVHLLSTHQPYVFDADCKIRGGQATKDRSAAVIQVGCAIDAFASLLDFLKRAEIYDRSLILLISDTGAGLSSDYVASTSDKPVWARLVGRANPIFLIKPPGAEGALREAAGSIQPSDLAATVCAILGDCVAQGGVSVLDAAAEPRRPRVFHHYAWRQEYWGRDVLPNIDSYQVDGPLWERTAWTNYAYDW